LPFATQQLPAEHPQEAPDVAHHLHPAHGPAWRLEVEGRDGIIGTWTCRFSAHPQLQLRTPSILGSEHAKGFGVVVQEGMPYDVGMEQQVQQSRRCCRPEPPRAGVLACPGHAGVDAWAHMGGQSGSAAARWSHAVQPGTWQPCDPAALRPCTLTQAGRRNGRCMAHGAHDWPPAARHRN